MTARPIPDDLLPWALASLGLERGGPLEAVAGDASSRRYSRLRSGADSYIVVNAPPATEKNAEFLAVRQALEDGGITVPRLYAADLDRGYLLLGDLGEELLLPLLDEHTADGHYADAMAVLRRLAQLPDPGPAWPAYDRALLAEELGRFPEWFVTALLGHELDAGEREMLAAADEVLIRSALEQPRVLVHRDFHSRNLMPAPGGDLGVIDFQDAVRGPVTYDLVSLLRDCYICWPPERVRSWALSHRDWLLREGLIDVAEDERFLRWFDLMGLQRHIKVLGTFARLYLRDSKGVYLDDLPLVLHYVREILAARAHDEPALAALRDWFAGTLDPLVGEQPWGRSP